MVHIPFRMRWNSRRRTSPRCPIAYSNVIGLHRDPVHSRGVGCSLETLRYDVRCLASQDGSWATQVRGFLAWQWAKSGVVIDAATGEIVDPGWPGTQRNSALQASGRWIKRNLASDPCIPTQ